MEHLYQAIIQRHHKQSTVQGKGIKRILNINTIRNEADDSKLLKCYTVDTHTKA